MELKKSTVKFNAEQHTYELGGKSLSGITGIIRKLILLDNSEVPEFVFAEGKNFHLEVQAAMDGFEPANPSERFKRFIEATKEIKFQESEYLISDDKHFASSIDLVDEAGNLYDIKTNTTEIDRLYVTWQLSVYKYLFKLQNGFDAGDIFCIHAKEDGCEVIKLEPVKEENVIKLLDAAANGKPYSQGNEELANSIAYYTGLIKEMQTTLDSYKEQMMVAMQDDDVKSYKGDGFTISYTPETTSKTFDSTAFKKENADLAARYMKESLRKASVSVRFSNSK